MSAERYTLTALGLLAAALATAAGNVASWHAGGPAVSGLTVLAAALAVAGIAAYYLAETTPTTARAGQTQPAKHAASCKPNPTPAPAAAAGAGGRELSADPVSCDPVSCDPATPVGQAPAPLTPEMITGREMGPGEDHPAWCDRAECVATPLEGGGTEYLHRWAGDFVELMENTGPTGRTQLSIFLFGELSDVPECAADRDSAAAGDWHPLETDLARLAAEVATARAWLAERRAEVIPGECVA